MISIIYSTHKDENYNKKFKQHLLQNVGLKDVQILEYINHNQYGLSELYNKGIEDSKYNIVVCCHNDIKLEKNWGKKLLSDFEKNPEFGIIGKAGTCYFPESGIYWEKMSESMVGQVYHQPEENTKWLSKYSTKTNDLTPVVSIDGLFISFDKTKIKHTFDESIGRFHFYDHPFCLSNYLEGVKIGVTHSFEITHQSVGRPNDEFFESKIKFLEKYSKFLPINLEPNKIYYNKINEKPLKSGKVAIIIPTKNKFNLIERCVLSFYKHCNNNRFDIYIADTGSNEEEKTRLKNFISSYDNIKLLEYDYYNFAKINNDVVNNHISNDYEFLLFSNNDIEILNNVIYGMTKTFKDYPNTGTVGCRLHYENNTTQHDGILFFVRRNKPNHLEITHDNIRGYYRFHKGVREVVGSTAALMMIRKEVFEKMGGFNESYDKCLEDIELNLKCMLSGYKNYCNSDCVAYHYESQTRREVEANEGIQEDYYRRLIPFINSNINKIKKYIILE